MPSRHSPVNKLGGDFLRYLRRVGRAGLGTGAEGALSRRCTTASLVSCGMAAAVEGPVPRWGSTGEQRGSGAARALGVIPNVVRDRLMRRPFEIFSVCVYGEERRRKWPN